MTAEPAPGTGLADLSDRDLLLNLWFQLVFMVDHFQIDSEAGTTSVMQLEGPDLSADDRRATLDQLMTEVENRLGLAEVEFVAEDGHAHWN